MLHGVDLPLALCVLGLVALRVTPAVFLVPYLGGPRVPLTVRVALALTLIGWLSPAVYHMAVGARSDVAVGAEVMVTWFVQEAFVGISIAVVCALSFWVVAFAGGFIERLRGTPAEVSSDTLTADGPVARVVTVTAVALFVVSGGHLLAIAALGRTYSAWPPWALGQPEGSFLATLFGLGELFTAVAALTLPFAVAHWLADLTVGLLQRSAPQLRSFIVALPLNRALGVLLLLVSIHILSTQAGSDTWGVLSSLGTLFGEQ